MPFDSTMRSVSYKHYGNGEDVCLAIKLFPWIFRDIRRRLRENCARNAGESKAESVCGENRSSWYLSAN